MGITIRARKPPLATTAPPAGTRTPIESELVLECDSGRHVKPRVDVFQHPDGFIPQRRSAMITGWKEIFARRTPGGPTERLYLCPECSGKRWSST